MSRAQLLTKPERHKLRQVLGQWRIPPAVIREVLRGGVFGPGVLAFDQDGVDRGVAIMVDERRDAQLARLFDRRAELDNDAFLGEFESGAPRAHTLFCPDRPEALFAFTVCVDRPIAPTRTYLLLVSKQARMLSFLCQRGATICLVPHVVALREWAKEGTGTGYDLYSRALPVGLVTAARSRRVVRAMTQVTRHPLAVADETMFVVHVKDTISVPLAGHEGVEYRSPPLQREEALTLVRVLLCEDRRGAETRSWRCAIAGGQRTLTIRPVRAGDHSANGGQPANGALP